MANVTGSARAYVAFQVRVYPELKERLMQRSMETGVSQREIVSEALKRYLAEASSSGDKAVPGGAFK